MAEPQMPRYRGEFEIALICALTKESDAVEALFDGYWRDRGVKYGKARGDDNTYTTGWIGGHNVVLAYMPNMGKSGAASVSANLRTSFPGVRLGLIVGICGGVPSQAGKDEILLGDVVISTSVVQFDFGSRYPDTLKRKDTLSDNLARPNREIRSFLHQMAGKAGTKRLRLHTAGHVRELCAKEGFEESKYPSADEDRLYEPGYRHKHQNPTVCKVCANCEKHDDSVCEIAVKATCAELGCDDSKLVPRERLRNLRLATRNTSGSAPEAKRARLDDTAYTPIPWVHFGSVASGDWVMKSDMHRDLIASQEKVIAYEMEAAGTWDNIPTIVIKGVCDYADSHKNKNWQEYAAATAAACMKAFLNEWPAVDRPPQFIEIPLATETIEVQDDLTSQRTLDQQRCLQSLAFPEMYMRQNDIKDAATETCAWLRYHPSYTTWLNQHQGLLWIKGKPGAGKSTLVKYALGEDKQQSSANERVIASFFFDGSGAQIQKTALGLFRSLLHQILDQVPNFLAEFTSIFKKCETQGEAGQKWQWHLTELGNFLEMCISKSPTACPVRIFVDALDECGVETATEVVSYFQRLNSKLNSDSSRLSICFSCRHYPVIALDHGFVVCVEDENRLDIAKYIHDELIHGLSDEEQVQRLTNHIVGAASGVFQWAALVLQTILKLQRNGRGKAIWKKLRELPTDLHKLYDRILKDIDIEERSGALRLLQWICFAKRPLSLQELRYAMIIDEHSAYISLSEFENSDDFMETDEEVARRVTSLSGGLAEVREHQHKLVAQFTHQSVYDYLVQTGLSELEGESRIPVIPGGHFRLSRSCIKYLTMSEVLSYKIEKYDIFRDYDRRKLQIQELEQKFAFLQYATFNWYLHAQVVEARQILQHDLLSRFQWPSDGIIQSWISIYDGLADYPGNSGTDDGTTLLHVASIYNFLSVVDALLRTTTDFNLNRKDHTERTPLSCAAGRGHEAVVKQLLATGRIDANSKDRYGQTPLHYAVRGGHEAVVRQLLATGQVDADSKDIYGQTPLHYAVMRGHEAVVRQLLATGQVDVDSEDGQGLTPLSWAAMRGHEALVRQLLATGQVEADSMDNTDTTPLSWAARIGHEAVVRQLLDTGQVEADSMDNTGRTPLSWAAEEGHETVVRLLLATGMVDVYQTDWEGQTPLLYAEAEEHEVVVELLEQ